MIRYILHIILSIHKLICHQFITFLPLYNQQKGEPFNNASVLKNQAKKEGKQNFV